MTKKELIKTLEGKCYSPLDIEEWIAFPNPFFGGKTPLELIKEKNTELLEKFLKN